MRKMTSQNAAKLGLFDRGILRAGMYAGLALATWLVYLPAGVWFDHWTGARHEGGRMIRVEAPLETVPLFVRGGAIVPMRELSESNQRLDRAASTTEGRDRSAPPEADGGGGEAGWS